MSMLRPFWSAHSRNFEAPMSGLFWWSATSVTILRPSTVPPKSAMAIFMASVAPGPLTSEYRPDRSSMSPITTSAARARRHARQARQRQSNRQGPQLHGRPLQWLFENQTPRKSRSTAILSGSCDAAKPSTIRPCSMT